jgi:hypothetical protein
MGVLAPHSIGGSVVLAVDVAETEAMFAQAVRAGAQRFVNRWQTSSGATRTATLRTRSGIAGTSPSTFATYHSMRSSPQPHRPSRECVPMGHQRAVRVWCDDLR